MKPCVKRTLSAFVDLMESISPSQSAWSDKTKPFSKPLRLRFPLTAHHPDATAVDDLPNLLDQVEFKALGGTITRALWNAFLSFEIRGLLVSGRDTPVAR